MLDEKNGHVGIYQVLDGVLSGAAVPPGAKGVMFSIIDRLRLASTPAEELRLAERVAVEIHKLQAALLGSDALSIQAARKELRSIAAAWIQVGISNRH
ncbi:MAG: hypothetical protein LH610_01655 [Sphingomonas bacterium]|nr:hypothetical protein [Sphingomonas bacterium]